MQLTMLEAALMDYGEAEIPGAGSNAKVSLWLHRAGVDHATDDVSWCGAAMRHWCVTAGFTPPLHAAAARSWLGWGFETHDPRPGDVVVFWRESPGSWKGHVGLFINRAGSMIRCLGGNQNDAVQIALYASDRVLGFRRATPPGPSA